MRPRFASALLTAALVAIPLGGCGATNEDSLGGQTSKAVPNKGDTPEFKGYGDAMKYQAEQAAKNRPAGKGKAAAKTTPSTPAPEKEAGEPAKTP